MAVKYANFASGTITDNPLDVGGTSISSAAFVQLPVIADGDSMWLVLDPDGNDGAPEIVKVTGHTSGSTSVTVQRAQQDTTARQHSQGTVWRCAVTRADLDSFALATNVADVASDIVAVQSDISDLQSDISDIEAGWVTHDPTITQSGATLNKTIHYSKYKKVGRTVHWTFRFTTTSAGSGPATVRLTLPHNAADVNALVGFGCVHQPPGDPKLALYTGLFSGTIGTQDSYSAFVAGTVILGHITYEAAS